MVNIKDQEIDWPALKIKHAIEKAGLSQASIARQLGVTTAAVNNVVYGDVSRPVRRAIADAIGVDVSEIWPTYYRTKQIRDVATS